MKTTTYLGTEYPEATDVADVPAQLYNIAKSWENAWGGLWLDWLPVVTQSSGGEPQALTLDTTNMHARVRKVGKTAYVQAYIPISANPGALTGYPLVFLPYQAASAYAPLGLVTSSVGGSIGTAMALVPTTGDYAGNTAVIEAFGASTARIANDWIGLLLRYETV